MYICSFEFWNFCGLMHITSKCTIVDILIEIDNYIGMANSASTEAKLLAFAWKVWQLPCQANELGIAPEFSNIRKMR